MLLFGSMFANNSFHSDRAGAGGFLIFLSVQNFLIFSKFTLHPARQVKLGVIQIT